MGRAAKRWVIAFWLGSSAAFAAEPVWTPLHTAVDRGDVAAALTLLSRQPALIEAREAGLHAPIHLAAGNGDVRMVNFLLDHRAELDARDICGWTPLHTAVFWNRPEVAELLVARGADLNAKDRQDQTPLRLAVKYRHVSSVVSVTSCKTVWMRLSRAVSP